MNGAEPAGAHAGGRADAGSARPPHALRIGITGPIGCGKSTVAGWLAEQGGVVIDADRLARELTAPGEPTLPAIRRRFGASVFDADGALDRAALARIVFTDRQALLDLEAIVHPAVRLRVTAAMAAAEAERAPFIVIEAIKLVEGGLAAAHCDEVWLIECPPEAQRARLIERGTDPDDAERRITAQGGDLVERLAAHATRRISTEGTSTETRARVVDALRQALARADR